MRVQNVLFISARTRQLREISGMTLFQLSGQVLSRQNIEDVIKFAKREKLFILADEVLIHTLSGVLLAGSQLE